jgi:hypothetical protein
LLDSRQILVSSDAGSNCNDMLGTKDLRGHSFLFNLASFANRLFRESGRGKELNREIFDEEMLAVHAPATFLEM